MPLKVKLLVVVVLALMVLSSVLVGSMVVNLNSMKAEIVQQTQTTMEEEVLGRLNSEARYLGQRIGGYINSAFRVPLGVARTLGAGIEKGEEGKLDRDQVNQLVSSTLGQHKDISSMYAQFEPNGYDGLDASFVGAEGRGIHTVADTGSLEIYWIRTPEGQLEQQEVEDASEKWVDTVGEFGIREAEWYLCSKDKKQPCLMEPYLYEISEGYSELMTSLAVPVLANGQFKGLVGVDINLPVFQTMIDTLKKGLYDGESKITILSEKGLVVASTEYSAHLTRPLSEARKSLGESLSGLHLQDKSYFERDGVYYVAQSVEIQAPGVVWSVLIELPEKVVLAGTQSLVETVDGSVLAIVSTEIVAAIVITAIVVFLMVVMIQSIVKPIRDLDDMIQNLASAEGDLTRDVRLNTHAELISLSKGFNLFTEKLRTMVNELKKVGVKAKDTASSGKAINARSVSATQNQQREIDSVVTATNEMSATANEVSQVAVEVADNASRARDTVISSQNALAGSVSTVQALTEDMQEASQSISEVASRTEDINRILDVIRAIAEQTNLLALNAAIEAARAGEQGRGFAVVADEVRSLASKTQSSTEEINGMIQSLQGGVKKAVGVIESSTVKAKGAMDETQASYESLAGVVADISSVSEHITQVATAAEEQSAVSEEISRNLTIIGDAASALAELAGESDQASEQLSRHMAVLDEQLASLKT